MGFQKGKSNDAAAVPFFKRAIVGDSVDVTVDLKGKRVSGPPLVFKQ